MRVQFGPEGNRRKYTLDGSKAFYRGSTQLDLSGPGLSALEFLTTRAGLQFTLAEILASHPGTDDQLEESVRKWIQDIRDALDDEDRKSAILVERRTGGRSTYRFAWPVLPEAEDPTRYLDQLEERCSRIDIRGLTVGSAKAHSFPIEDLYIPLKTHGISLPNRTPGSDSASPAQSADLETALAAPRLVIVGDPGSGKTTFLRRIALTAVREFRRAPEVKPFPILIGIAKLADFLGTAQTGAEAESPSRLAKFLALPNKDSTHGLTEEFFSDKLVKGPAILYFDGLDEAPTTDSREAIVRLFDSATIAYRHSCRFVVTTRPKSYEGRATLENFQTAEILPLEEPSIQLFLRKWCAVVAGLGNADSPANSVSATRHFNELNDALHAVPEIRRMARNMVMLSALAVVHWNEKRLPEQRAALYESILKWLVLSRERRDVVSRVSEDRCHTLMRLLALEMQQHPKGRQIEVEKEWAAERLAPKFASVAAARVFLDQEEIDSGIILSRGTSLRFRHLTFQEYLAAYQIFTWDDSKERVKFLLAGKRKPLYQPEWREVVLLLAGLLRSVLGESSANRLVSGILANLRSNASLAAKARCIGIVGAIINDLSPFKFQPDDPHYPGVRNEVLSIFSRQGAETVPFEDRLEAANALGQSGDPRLNENNWIPIEPGTVWMGTELEKADRRPVLIDRPFEIARFPVTVSEYAKFIEAGAYTDGQWGLGDGKLGQRVLPWFWDERQDGQNHPVTGISWYEADAYCRWRSIEERSVIRLLKEAEWELAARGAEDNSYPWGPKGDNLAARANYYDGKTYRGTTPVGLYPHGSTPTGVHDMAGNVWEWVEDAEIQEHGETLRVLRGGSYFVDAENLRCVARSVDRPGLSFNGFGLRVAREV